MTRGFIRATGVLAMVALLGAACASMDKSGGMSSRTDSKAADLRSALNGLLQEHVTLAAAATNAALGGRQPEFQAAAGALDQNSQDLAKAIGSVYGQGAQDAFLPLWRKHIGFFVDYTVGTATKDQAKQTKAVNDLVGYTQDFGAFLNSANPNLPKDVVAGLVRTHVLTLKDVVDAQASGDHVKTYAALHTASHHMEMIANPLAGAIVKQHPAKFPGNPDSSGAGLRVALNTLLREHVIVAAAATNAALAGRQTEFQAAAGSLDQNSQELAKAIGSVYGQGAQDAFLPLWRKHIGFFVDYTVGTATKDKAKQDKAVNDLVGYTQDFGAFLNSANPNLPKDVVAGLVRTHVLTLKDVVDAQASGDHVKAFAALRKATAHMSMIGDPLAGAIVKQFPQKFAAVQSH
jgi:hypothetical protein